MSTESLAPASRESNLRPSCVVTIGQAMPGFPDVSELAIVPVDEYGMFVWLSAPEHTEVAFLAVNPFLFFHEYDVYLTDADELLLGVEPGDELIVFCLVTVERETAQATANLLAPLVVNTTRERALQVILEGDHPLRAPLVVPGGEPFRASDEAAE